MQVAKKPHWSHSAKCKGMDTDLFFPTRAFLSVQKAKTVCASCPVRIECLEDSMNAETMLYGNRHGIFGGMTPKERERLQKQRIKNAN